MRRRSEGLKTRPLKVRGGNIGVLAFRLYHDIDRNISTTRYVSPIPKVGALKEAVEREREARRAAEARATAAEERAAVTSSGMVPGEDAASRWAEGLEAA